MSHFDWLKGPAFDTAESKRMRRSLAALFSFALLASPAALAQGTATIKGVVVDATTDKPVADAVVIAQSPSLQGEQTAVTDATGSFEITLLPPGTYQLIVQAPSFQPFTNPGLQAHISQSINVRLQVVPEAIQAQEKLITAVRPTIDTSSTTAGTVVDKKQMENIPYGSGARTFDQVAFAAPGVHGDALGLQINGATSPESNYVVDGVNVTNIAVGGLDSTLLQDFVEEVNVMTGGYLPEYGRSTGGVVSVRTRGGGDEFHGDIFGEVTPWLATPRLVTQAGAAISDLGKLNYQTTLGFDLSGYIIKKKLWFFAAFAPIISSSTVNRYVSTRDEDPVHPGMALKDSNGFDAFTRQDAFTRSYDESAHEYQFVGKLTYNINEDHNVSVSLTGIPSGSSGTLGSVNGDESTYLGHSTALNLDGEVQVHSKLFNKQMLVEGIASWHHTDGQSFGDDNVMDHSADYWNNYPQVNWQTVQPLSRFEPGDTVCRVKADGFDPCPVQGYNTGGIGGIGYSATNRYGAVLKFTNYFTALGHHEVKYGLDFERSTFEIQKQYSGGSYIFDQQDPSTGNEIFNYYSQYGYADPAHPGKFVIQPYLHEITATNSTALFLQDSWNLFDKVTLAGGVRWEVQSLYGADPATGGVQTTPAFTLPFNVAPRIGIIYDWTGRGMSKVYANYSRFYESIPLDMADRQFPSEKSVQEKHDPTQCTDFRDPRTCPLIHDGYGPGHDYKQLGANFTPVDPNLAGQFVTEMSAGTQYQWQDWKGEVDYEHTSLDRVIEDMSNDEGTTYFISNPGVPGDLGYSGRLANGATVLFPSPVRLYDAVTLRVSRPLGEDLNVSGSYTWSSLRGNYPGLFKADTGQLDPNISSEYDLISLLPNRYGPLPGDITHAFRLDGFYVFHPSPKIDVTFGTAASLRSGTPISYLAAHPVYGPDEAYLLPRGAGGRLPMIFNMDAQL